MEIGCLLQWGRLRPPGFRQDFAQPWFIVRVRVFLGTRVKISQIRVERNTGQFAFVSVASETRYFSSLGSGLSPNERSGSDFRWISLGRGKCAL